MEHSDNPQENGASPQVGQPSLGALEDASLDLVMAAAEGDDALIRDLLRTGVALGLTGAVGYWRWTGPSVAGSGSAQGPHWSQVRGFGGPTQAPSQPLFDASSGPPSSDSRAEWSGRQLQWTFGSRGAIVAARETFDRDGYRSDREDSLESLVVLAETLLVDDAELPSLLPHRDASRDEGESGDGLGGPRRAG